MKDAGVNMVRTGIWTGWKSTCRAGKLDEGELRAFDASAHGAQVRHSRHLHVLRVSAGRRGAANAYLDPRSGRRSNNSSQLSLNRCRHIDDVIWGFHQRAVVLLAESTCGTAPNYDAHEQAAWKQWLKNVIRTERRGTRDPTSTTFGALRDDVL